MRFRRSRYQYWWQYALVIALAFAWMYLRDSGSDALAFFSALGAAVGCIALEILIQLNAIVLTREGVDVHHARGSVFFAPFSHIIDVEVMDGALSRWLRFGAVRIISKQGSTVIKGVHEPARVVRAIKRKVHGNA